MQKTVEDAKNVFARLKEKSANSITLISYENLEENTYKNKELEYMILSSLDNFVRGFRELKDKSV